MGVDIHFRMLQNTKDLSQLTDFLASQELGYPDYDAWIQRAIVELDEGYKRAVLAWSEGRLVGDILFQPHKELPGFTELKNLRVHPALRDRYVALFLLRQAEVEAAGNNIICDARSDRPDIDRLLRFAGFRPIATVSLYDGETSDTIYVKIPKDVHAGRIIQ